MSTSRARGVPLALTVAAAVAGFVASASCGGGSSGSSPQCSVPADCSVPAGSICRVATCDQGRCGTALMAAGTPLPDPTPGDCQGLVCSAAGTAVAANADQDVPTGSVCLAAGCSGGVPTHTPAAPRTACSDSGGSLCDGAGSCVACLAPADCPGADSTCSTRTCVGGACGASHAATGTTCGSGQVCDGAGSCVTGCGSPSDCPGVDTQCASRTCVSTACGIADAPPRTACTGGLCDGAGACVECLAGPDCPSGVCSAAHACQAASCTDGVRNGDETDVDCGGSCPTRCSAHQACRIDGDCRRGLACRSLVCTDVSNGCLADTATDLTASATTTVTFPGAGFAYLPPCIRVKVGTVVTFSGAFSFHPLQGGAVIAGVATPAASGPFVPATTTGVSKDFTMTAAGDYPYYCTVHGTLGMAGAVFVDP